MYKYPFKQRIAETMRILIHFYILVTNEPKPNVRIVDRQILCLYVNLYVRCVQLRTRYNVDVIRMGSEKC